MNTESFIQKAAVVHSGRYKYDNAIYKNSKNKILVTCEKHGDFLISPNNHLNGHGCSKCCKVRGISQEQFLDKVKYLHPNLIFDKAIYKNNKSAVIVTCKKHGDYTTSARSLLGGHGCRKCYLESRILPFDDFVRRSKEIFGDDYEYDRSTYTTCHSRISVICKKHGLFTTTPNSLLDKHGCPRCYGCYADGNVRSTFEFVSQSVAVHGDRYNYSNSIYHKSTDKIGIECSICGNHFFQLPGNHLQGSGCPYCHLSKSHREIMDFLKQFGNVIQNDRIAIDPYEIDCYMPELRFGVEHHGLYWHSEGSNNRYNATFNKYSHQYKSICAMSNKLSLLQFWDFEWFNKRKLVESIIRNKLRLSSHKHNARELDISIIDDNTAKTFYNNNHLLGYRSAKIHLSLDNIMMVSFSPIQHNRWEIIRIASLMDNIVRGGVNKLISHFIKLLRPKCIVTYADMRYSVGNVYNSCGFTACGKTSPGYFYYKGNSILSRQRCQKHKLKNLLENYDDDLSESANMFINGYRRVWDAGHLKYELRLTN